MIIDTLSAMDFPILAAWWGAALSTLLGIIKIWEKWNTRFRIDIGYMFTGSPTEGNEMFVRNLASHPIIIGYWEVLLVSGIWPFRSYKTLVSPEQFASDIRIEAHSSETFIFRNEDHFSWSNKTLKGKPIYMRLHIAGRHPMLKKVNN